MAHLETFVCFWGMWRIHWCQRGFLSFQWPSCFYSFCHSRHSESLILTDFKTWDHSFAKFITSSYKVFGWELLTSFEIIKMRILVDRIQITCWMNCDGNVSGLILPLVSPHSFTHMRSYLLCFKSIISIYQIAKSHFQCHISNVIYLISYILKFMSNGMSFILDLNLIS